MSFDGFIAKLAADRTAAKKDFEAKASTIAQGKSVESLHTSFAKSASEAVVAQDPSLKPIGLHTLQEYEKKVAEQKAKEALAEEILKKRELDASQLRKQEIKRARELQNKSCVRSFEDEEEDAVAPDTTTAAAAATDGGAARDAEAAASAPLFKRPKMIKNPNADTSFLPDKAREELAEIERQRLAKEWEEDQKAKMQLMMRVAFVFYEGQGSTNHYEVQIPRGFTVGQFLDRARTEIQKEFKELRNAPVESLLYIKEDLILPHDITFHWLIETRARGKSGPLYVHEAVQDVRLVNDYNKEVTESHAGKVVERHWYEKNKHVFPMVRWEIFDREKRFDRYTAKDGRQGDRINFAPTLPSATAAAAAGLIMPAAFLSVKAIDGKANAKAKLWDDEAWRSRSEHGLH